MKALRLLLLVTLLVCAGRSLAGTVTYYYTDAQGTPLVEADAQGNITATYDYMPYGGLTLGAAPNGPGYTGHVNDPDTSLVYMQARYYLPEGQFLSVDPVLPEAGDVFGFNRYAYAGNNPIVHTDPNGRQTLPGSVYELDWSNPQTREGLREYAKDTAVSTFPLVNDVQNIVQAVKEPSAFSITVAAIGALPEVGGVVVKTIKEGEVITRIGGEAEKVIPSGKRSFSISDRNAGFERAKDVNGVARCEYCGTELTSESGYPNSYEADHTVPYSRGGPSTPDNLTPSCRSCNRVKGARTPDEWETP